MHTIYIFITLLSNNSFSNSLSLKTLAKFPGMILTDYPTTCPPKKHREKANSDVVEQFSHSDTDSFKFTFFKDNDKWQIQQIYPILGLVLSEIFYKT